MSKPRDPGAGTADPNNLADAKLADAKVVSVPVVMPGNGARHPLPGVKVAEGNTGKIARLARAHGEEAIRTLAEIMKDPNAAVTARITAASAILDRGFGRPGQSIDITQQSYDMTALHLEAMRSLIKEREAMRAVVDITPAGTKAGTDAS